MFFPKTLARGCDRTFIRLLLFLLYCFCFTAGLFVFLRLHFMVRCPISRGSNHLSEQLRAHEANYALSFFREEVDRPISVQV